MRNIINEKTVFFYRGFSAGNEHIDGSVNGGGGE
jgi:hypothetical protein